MSKKAVEATKAYLAHVAEILNCVISMEHLNTVNIARIVYFLLRPDQSIVLQ